MRTAVRIILISAITLITFPLVAATASAQETEVEAVDEPSGAPCNPCGIHIEGESHIRAMPANVIVSTCTDEFFLDIYHDGHGELEWNGVTDQLPGCNTLNCVVNNPHWPAVNLGELGNGREHISVTFCLRAGATEITCTGEIQIAERPDLATHLYEFSTGAGIPCLNGARIIEGHWSTEHDFADPDDGEMELVHHS